MLRSLQKGHGSGLPFSRGGVAYRAPTDPGRDRRGTSGSGARSGSGHDEYGYTQGFERFAADYGWSPDYIVNHLTDEQFYLYLEKGSLRRNQEAWAEQERIVYGVNWGTALAHDQKGRARRKWQSLARKMSGRKESAGLSGAALEQAVMSLALADPSLVKIQSGVS